eukprot:scaffold287282_cov24-Tisochrysis_lutea.AAC.2
MIPPASGEPVTATPGSETQVRSLAPIQQPMPGMPEAVPRQREAATASSPGPSKRASVAPGKSAPHACAAARAVVAIPFRAAKHPPPPAVKPCGHRPVCWCPGRGGCTRVRESDCGSPSRVTKPQPDRADKVDVLHLVQRAPHGIAVDGMLPSSIGQLAIRKPPSRIGATRRVALPRHLERGGRRGSGLRLFKEARSKEVGKNRRRRRAGGRVCLSRLLEAHQPELVHRVYL